MPSEHLFLYWGLLLMVVPLVSSGLGGGQGRADRFFLGACVPVTFLLVAFVPRFGFSLALAAAATFAYSGLVAAVYLALSPAAVRTWPGLLLVLCVVDGAALGTLHFSLRAGLALPALAGLLVAATGLVGLAAVWVVRRTQRTRHIGVR